MKNILLPLLLFTIVSTSAFSQADVFMKIDGVDGAATQRGFERWIELISVDQSMSNNGSKQMGGAGAGRPSFSDIKIKKGVDKTSPLLAIKAVTGSHYPVVTITFAGVNGNESYTIILKEVFISGVSTDTECNPACKTFEEIRLSFGEITWEYKESNGTITRKGYNVKTARTF